MLTLVWSDLKRIDLIAASLISLLVLSKKMNFQKSKPKSILMLSYFLAKKLTSTVTLGIYQTCCLKVTCSNCIIQLSQQVYSIKLRERSVNNAPGQCGYGEHRVFLEKKHGLHLAIYMYVVQSSFRTLHYEDPLFSKHEKKL